MTGHIGPLVQKSTPSIIADKLRAAIGHGELKPGEQLGEAELARRLGVSRGPLREGMQRLTQEGLLVAIRNRGLFVIDMTAEDISDMYLAREAVERAAARAVIRRGDHADVGEALLAIVDRMRGRPPPPRSASSTSPSTSGWCSCRAARGWPASTARTSPRRGCASTPSRTATPNPISARPSTANWPRPSARAMPRLADRLLIEHMDDALARLIDNPAVDEAEPVSI